VVADLLEPHEERQYQPLALNAFNSLQLLRQLVDCSLVERRLLGAELAERLNLGLVRQIGDDRLVGLHAPQNIRPHQFAQWAEGVMGSRARCLVKLVNSLAEPSRPD